MTETQSLPRWKRQRIEETYMQGLVGFEEYQLRYAIARVFVGGGRGDGEEEKEDCRRQRRGEHFYLFFY